MTGNLGLMWRLGVVAVAHTWQCHSGKNGEALGPRVAGDGLHGGGRREYHKKEENARSMVRSPTRRGEDGGGRRRGRSGGADRFNGGDAFRRVSGEDGERTVEASMPRCRWCGR